MSDDNAEDHEQSYTIIKFLNEFTSKGKVLIELVPSSWTFLAKNDQWKCKWPEQEGKPMETMIKELHAPADDWPSFAIEKLSYAGSYKQGKRRLKRAYNKSTGLESTDSECSQNEPFIMPKNVAKKILGKKRSPLLSSVEEETIAENSEDSSADVRNLVPRNDESDLVITTDANGNPDDGRSSTSKPQKNNVQFVHERLGTLRAQADTELKEFLTEYIDATAKVILQSVSSAKRSLQYDIEKKFYNLTISLNAKTTDDGQGKNSVQAILEVPLPIPTQEDFLKFEASLRSENLEDCDQQQKALKKQRTLINFFENITQDSGSYESDIKTILSRLLAKAVQINYSAMGKQVRGVAKLKFVTTKTFLCMEVLNIKYEKRNYALKIIGVTSRWFSGAADREGGYAERKNERS